MNVYKVDSHLKVENKAGVEVMQPGSFQSQLVCAESPEAAIAGAAKARGEGFEAEHVSNVCQDVLVVPAAKKPAAKPAADKEPAPADKKLATEKVQ